MNKKLITLLENEFGMNYFDIIKLVINSNVKITENDIKIHMYKK